MEVAAVVQRVADGGGRRRVDEDHVAVLREL